MVKLYAKLVLAGMKTLEEVPEALRAAVAAEVEKG